MKFSIATPVFNGMPWLSCCLASVQDQQRPGLEIEHIVQDGGSTDDSLHILRGAAGIRWESAFDAGMYDAINHAWEKSSGDILSYINSDEQYLPDALQTVQEVFERSGDIDILFCDALVVDRQCNLLSYRRIVRPSALHTQVVHLGTMSCSMFFRRHLFDRGLHFDPRWKAIADAEWVVRAIRSGVRIALLPKPVAAFTITGANMGANPKALAEATRWRREASMAARLAAPLLKARYWSQKLLGGAYVRRKVLTKLYLPEDCSQRVARSALNLGHQWPSAGTNSI